MADLLSLVLANHRNPHAQSQNDNGNDITEHTKRATTELHPDIRNWKLPETVLRKQLAEGKQDDDSDSDDSDSESKKGKRIPRDELLNPFDQYRADVDSDTTSAAFAAQHYHDVSRHIRKDSRKKRNHRGTLLHYLVQGGAKPSWNVWAIFILHVVKHLPVKVLILQGRQVMKKPVCMRPSSPVKVFLFISLAVHGA
jgi:hypothetical protein